MRPFQALACVSNFLGRCIALRGLLTTILGPDSAYSIIGARVLLNMMEIVAGRDCDTVGGEM
jgi:hypothetical protein